MLAESAIEATFCHVFGIMHRMLSLQIVLDEGRGNRKSAKNKGTKIENEKRIAAIRNQESNLQIRYRLTHTDTLYPITTFPLRHL